MDHFNLSSTKLNEIQNPDDFIVVWTFSNDVPTELNNFVDYFMKFNSNEVALMCIEQFKSERKILLILTDFESLSTFENKNLSQIQSIYVFEKKRLNIEFKKEDHPQLVDIFEDINELIDRLRKDILLIHRSDLPISISSINEIKLEQSLTSLHGYTLPFLWDQIFCHYLIKHPKVDMEELKEDMLKQCRLEYQHDPREIEKINAFGQECSKDNILKWYTKDSFLYRLLNKAFRTRNIELICKFQYCIILLHEKFQDLSKEQEENPSFVYRGQILNENTLKTLKLNVGRLISWNTIMSTSCDEDIARVYILGAAHAVVFKIDLQKQSSNSLKPFIDISNSSSMTEEKEFLFFVGTVFSIDSVEQESESTWFIKLTLHDEISKHIEKLASDFQPYIITLYIQPRSFMKTDDFNMIDQYYSMLTGQTFSLNNTPTTMMYIYVAFSFSNLGFYEKAIHFYEQVISMGNISVDSPEWKVLHIIIGYLYYHASKYDNAFIYYGIVLSLLAETDLLTSELYNHIGDVWNKIKKEDIALSCYEEALKIANRQDIPSLPNIYQNIIGILKKEEKFEKASVYKEQAKKIDKRQYHISTPRLDAKTLSKCESQLNNGSNLTPIERGDLLYKIGLCFMEKNDFDRALTKLLEAKKLFLEEHPPWSRFPRQLPTLFDNIAFVYLCLQDHLKALTMWKRAIDIRNNFYPH